MILKVNRSDTQSNMTVSVYGVDCYTVQDMSVICEEKKGIILCKIINFNYQFAPMLKVHTLLVNVEVSKRRCRYPSAKSSHEIKALW